MAKEYLVRTRLVTIFDPTGTQKLPHNQSKKFPWRTWGKYKDRLDNIVAAIDYVVNVRDTHKPVGGIVVIQEVTDGRVSERQKIYEAKTTTNTIPVPYSAFYGPVGDYYMRQLREKMGREWVSARMSKPY